MSVSADPQCILNRLREDTHQHHQDIEGAIPVMKPDLSKEEYVRILQKFHRFYKTFEAELKTHKALQAMVPDLNSRLKLSLLEADLQHFGESPDSSGSSEISSNSSSQAPLLGQTAFTALGALYVMEGSSLGGQVISKHLQSQLALTKQAGASYYNAYGSETGKMWQTFKSYLKAHVQSASEKDQTVQGAQAAFTALKMAMQS